MNETDELDHRTPAPLAYHSPQVESHSAAVMFGTIGTKLLGLYFTLGFVQTLSHLFLSLVPVGGVGAPAGVKWTTVLAWSAPSLITCAIGVVLFLRARELAIWMFRDLPAPPHSGLSAATLMTAAVVAIGFFMIVQALPVLFTSLANWISRRSGMNTYFASGSWDIWDQHLTTTGIANGCIRLVVGVLLVCFARRIAGHRMLRGG